MWFVLIGGIFGVVLSILSWLFALFFGVYAGMRGIQAAEFTITLWFFANIAAFVLVWLYAAFMAWHYRRQSRPIDSDQY